MRHGRRDDNEAELVQLWRDIGGSWLPLDGQRRGVPDGIAALRGRDFMVEIKRPRKGRRPEQVEWAYRWHGTVIVWHTREDVIATRDAITVTGNFSTTDGLR